MFLPPSATSRACYSVDSQKTLVSYHPNRRNTITGKLTWSMWVDVFKRARSLIVNKLDLNDLLKSTIVTRLTTLDKASVFEPRYHTLPLAF